MGEQNICEGLLLLVRGVGEMLVLLAYYSDAIGYFPDDFGPGTVPVEKVYAVHRDYIMACNHGASYYEQKARIIFFQTFSGLVARNSKIRLYVIGVYAWEKWLGMARVPVDYTYDVDDPDMLWQLAADFKKYTSGYYLKCNVTNESVNWATSLAAKYNAPVVDGSIASYVEAAGYTLLKTFDAAGGADYTDESTVWSEWSAWSGACRKLIFDQLDYNADEEDVWQGYPTPMFWALRDYIVATGSWCSYRDEIETDSTTRDTYQNFCDDDSMNMGWLGHRRADWPLGWSESEIAEDAHVKATSQNGLQEVCSDHRANNTTLSLCEIDDTRLRVRWHTHLKDLEYPGDYSYVAFQLTDGDNVGFLAGDISDLPFGERGYMDPDKENIPFGWCLCVPLFELVPQAVEWYVDNSCPTVDFGLPVSGGGYFYYDEYGYDLTAHYERVNKYMEKYGLSYLVTMMYANTLPLDFTPAVYNISKATGGFVYSYGQGYNAFGGAVRWGTNSEGKDFPFISCKYRVWEGLSTENDVVTAINSETGQNFDLVVLHAWTVMKDSYGGPIQTAERIIQNLDSSHVKVVTPEGLLLLYRLANKPEQILDEWLDELYDGISDLQARVEPGSQAASYLSLAVSYYTSAKDDYNASQWEACFNNAKQCDVNLTMARLACSKAVEIGTGQWQVEVPPVSWHPVHFYDTTELYSDVLPFSEIQLQVAEDPNFKSIIKDRIIKTDKFAVYVEPGSTVYIRFRVRNLYELGGEWGPWSDVIVYSRPKADVKVTVYPNPAVSKVKFSVSSGVSLKKIYVKVYDLFGRPVWSTESTSLNIEWNMIRGDGKKLPKGVYVYVVEAEDGYGARMTSRVGKIIVKD